VFPWCCSTYCCLPYEVRAVAHQDIDQLFGELAKWVRKRLHTASCIDDFVNSLQEFLDHGIHRPFDKLRRVIKMNTIRDWKASLSVLCCLACRAYGCLTHMLLAWGAPLVGMHVQGLAGAIRAHRRGHWWPTCSPLL